MFGDNRQGSFGPSEPWGLSLIDPNFGIYLRDTPAGGRSKLAHVSWHMPNLRCLNDYTAIVSPVQARPAANDDPWNNGSSYSDEPPF